MNESEHQPETPPHDPRPAEGKAGRVTPSTAGPFPPNTVADAPKLWPRRLAAGVVLALCLTLLLTARSLAPASEGVGTHTQLGLPSCHFKATVGLPCLTCGMTTAFSHATRGQFLDAFLAQPTGFFLALAAAGASVVSAVALWTGASLAALALWLFRPRLVIAAVVILLASWAYKILLLGGVL